MSRRWVWPLSLLMVLLVFWTIFLGQAEKSVFGRVPLLDEIYFLDHARDLSASGLATAEPFFVSPLYPLLIGLTGSGGEAPEVRVFAPGILRGIRFFQISCWLAVVVLLRLTAGRAFGPDLSPGRQRDLFLWLPAILFVLYRPAAVYAVSVLLELPLVLLVTLGIYLMTRLPDDETQAPGNRWVIPLALGAVLGLAGLLRGTSLLLLIPAAWLVARTAVGWPQRLGRVLLVFGACAVILGPSVIHNSRIAGRVTGPTLNAGVNLYIGNGPEANGFYVAVVPGDWRRDPAGRTFLAERLGRATPSLADADRIWTQEAARVIKEHPGRTLGLWLKKVWLHLQGWEIDQLTSLTRWRLAAPALGWLIVPYALLVVLAAAGMISCWSRASVRRWTAVLAVLVAGQSVFFVVSRYRLALVPVLCLLAAAGLRVILRRKRAAFLAAAAAAVLVVPWGLAETRDLWRVQALANEAHRWAEIGEAEDSVAARRTAEILFRESLAGEPAGPAPWLGLAALLVERGEKEEAARILEEGIPATTRNLEIQKTLLALWLEGGRRSEALNLTSAILADHPREADTLHNRAVLLADLDRSAEAAAAAGALIAAHPDDARGYIDLGVILARSGRPDQARTVFQQGLQVLPDDPRLLQNLQLLDR